MGWLICWRNSNEYVAASKDPEFARIPRKGTPTRIWYASKKFFTQSSSDEPWILRDRLQ
jgi:hypothetical protein